MDSESDYDNDERISDWKDDENDHENIEIIDLFSSQIFTSITSFLEYNLKEYNFDIITILKENIGIDEVNIIMFINYIRELNSNNLLNIQQINELLLTNKEFLLNEKYMLPFLENDQLLYLLSEYLNDYDPNNEEEKDDQIWENSNNNLHIFQNVNAPTIDDLTSKITITKEEINKSLENNEKFEDDEQLSNDYYFDGYSHIGIHETMLRDFSRTSAYAEALNNNSEFLKDKIVLDVGCGTGILSLLAARAGAKKVIGVDMSSIITRSRRVVEKNGFQNIITLIRGKIEEVILPLEEGEEIDIIVSEWMGYGLYFENMLPAVLYARDKYLKKDANLCNLMPSHASLFIEAISITSEELSEDRVTWWNDVYGFDMSDMTDLFLHEAQVDIIPSNIISSNRELFHELTILTTQYKDLDFIRPFQLILSSNCLVSAFVISFDVLFTPFSDSISPVILSTGTSVTPTHWKQTVLWLPVQRRFFGSRNDKVIGTIKYLRSKENDRDYEITLCWRVEKLEDRSVSEEFSYKYFLGSS